ncbi:hypothetical protein GEMRC1_009784 [Eukaryota sp. GEM-RC1]
MRCWSYSSACCRLTTSLSHAPQEQGSIMRCWSYSSACCRLTTSLSHAPQEQGSIMRCWRIIFVSASETAHVNCVHVLSIIPSTSSRNIPQMILCVVSSSISALCLILRIVFSSRPPFKEDLTMDGDVESNPGPLSKDSLEYLNPGQWIDDDAIFQYCQYLFNSARLAFDLYSIPSSVMNGLITDLSPEHKQTVDRQILTAKTTGTRFLIAPINDGMTALSASRTFSGSHWGVIL